MMYVCCRLPSHAEH